MARLSNPFGLYVANRCRACAILRWVGISSGTIAVAPAYLVNNKFSFLPHDPKQAIRVRRMLMATQTSLVVILLILLSAWLGFLTWQVFVRAAVIIVGWNLLFYGVFRSGLNLKAEDKSLTRAQMLAALLTMLYVMYHANGARGVFLVVVLMIFVFGIFRLTTRDFLTMGAILLAAYAAMIWYLAETQPALDVGLEWLHWLVLAIVLPWFAFIGGYIGRLRRRLTESISELESSQALAVHDDLTGTFNRRYLMSALYKEKNRSDRGAEAFCVCLIDLDRFKTINDTKGHLAGDVVLKTLVAAITPEVRSTDYFGRYGGEEFMLILSETPLAGAHAYAERVRHTAEALQFPDLAAGIRITVSVGLARYRPREEISALLARADAALYQAKALGRNRVATEDEQQRSSWSTAAST
jgi:diguanylate cyclase